MFSSNTSNVSGETPDAQFNYVTMLLHGDGTNGAQNNTFLDSSTNNFTIIRNGNTTQGTFSPYGSNWSNYFDGSSYLTTSSTQIIPTGSFTVECYVFVTGSGSNQKFVSQGSSGAAGRFSLGIEGGNWFTQLAGDLIQTGTPVKNQWNYVAVTYNGSTITLYVNGTSIGTVSSSANAQNAALTIGQDWNAYTTTGYISNVRVSNTVRTITAPTSAYTSDANTRLLACQSNRFLDTSSNAFAFTITGSPSVQRFNPFGTSTAYSTSVIGGSGYFDSSGDRLAIASGTTAASMGLGDFTIECWYYPAAAISSDVATLFSSTQSDSSSVTAINLNVFDNKVVKINDSFATSNTVVVGAWNHIVASRVSAVTKIFINGVQGSSAADINNYTSNGCLIGARYVGGQYYQVVNGYICDMKVTKGSGVTSVTVPTAPLTTSGSPALLANMTNGAIFDNAMMNDLETVGNAQISTSVKKFGTGSLVFDGTGDYLQAPDSPIFNFGSGNWTIEGWFYISTAKNYNGWFGKRQTGLFGFTLQIDSSGVLSISASITGSTWALAGASLGGGYSAGAWMHIAVTRNGTTITGWLNGTSTGTQTLSGAIFPANGFPATIGSSNDSGQEYNGYIDDFRITNGVARYTTTFTPPTAAFPNTGPL